MNINYSTRYIGLVILLTVGLFLLTQNTYAQFMSLPTSATLSASPRYPEPGSAYVMEINAPSIELSGMNIIWQVNGTARPEFANERTVTLTAPELGTPVVITATLQAGNNVTRLETTVVPSAVDVVIEGATVVPHFYKGRALPSGGAQVRVVAVPHLFTTNGTPVAADTLSYRWSFNDKLVHSGKGASVLMTELPRLSDTFLTLAIENESGTVNHTSMIAIPQAEPLVRFYEEHPLYGLARNAIKSRFALSGDEVTIKAEPYFVSADIFSNAQYAWTLNRTKIENPSTDPRHITLRRTGAGGESEVGFSIRNLNALTQYAANLFTIDFTEQNNFISLP